MIRETIKTVLASTFALALVAILGVGFYTILNRLDDAAARQRQANADIGDVNVQFTDLLPQIAQSNELAMEQVQMLKQHADQMQVLRKEHERQRDAILAEAKQNREVLHGRIEDLHRQLCEAAARQDALSKEVVALRYPALPEDEKPLFALYFASVWPPRPYFKKEEMPKGHLGVELVWQEPVDKPSDSLLTKIVTCYDKLGSAIGRPLAVESNEKKDHWAVAWAYHKELKDNKPIGIMNIEVFPDRLRVLWYPGRAKEKLEETPGLRQALLDLARTTGAKAHTGYWGPRSAGHTDLYFKP